MSNVRKLGRTSDQREAMLRGMVTSLLYYGKIQTTETRAKEVQKVAEKLIAAAAKESDNFTSKSVTVSKAKTDSKGNKLTVSKTSKNGKVYDVIDREKVSEMVRVDNPSRLNARRTAMKYVYRLSDKDGNKINVVSKLFDEIGPKYKDVHGGYTRIINLGTRRGDAAEVVVLELV